jgi:hypothetical protein
MTKDKREPKPHPAPVVFSKPTALAIKLDQLKVKRSFDLNLISISKLGQLVMMCQSELKLTSLPSKYAENGKADAYTIDVMDCETGEEIMLACNTVLTSKLKRAGEPLAGRYFAVRVKEIVAGKRYRDVDVVELERMG